MIDALHEHDDGYGDDADRYDGVAVAATDDVIKPKRKKKCKGKGRRRREDEGRH